MIKSSERTIFRIILTASISVFLLVIVLNKRIIPAPSSIPTFAYYLPKVNAFINGTCFVLLLVSFYFVKRKQFKIHQRINILAFFLSALFLMSYITYHYLVPETHYGGQGWLKSFYYFILITHIILAAVVLPLILLSFYYGLNDNRYKHRKLVRWSFPIWVYVTFTGVLVYALLSPYYNFPI